MDTTGVSFVSRKLIVTFVTAILVAMIMSLFNVDLTIYEQGNHFVGWTFVFFLYAGAIILVYGNIISIGVELLQRKYFARHKWLYVVILGLLGALFGIFYEERLLAVFGFFSAVFFAFLDLWLIRSSFKTKQLFFLILSPMLTLLCLWLYLQLMSPPLPPFTQEDAVTFATSGEGTMISEFPKEVGTWTGTIGDYEVKRETSVSSIDDEEYIVTFTEEWKRGEILGSSLTSYIVDRNSMTINKSEGNSPPYYVKKP
ncbi:hypothetical protein SAMN05518871_104154 [Psychrobacillus sp. OK028]|uniref:hypothetical protein n=1 Tax=Psychrobacillus sp. OK028 TaxID=1884359 RepID=UPI00088F5C36|nr:hypothetical protein [Psychrobacillus sp. OK028]SDN27990.1 hypothetical protein SAMN05518871_104154 [Psychrobacillus sp. OK028]